MASEIRWRDVRETLRLDEVEDALGLDVVYSGDEHIVSCPLSTHSGTDENPSFSINSVEYVYNCFSCNGSGSLPDLVEDMLEMDSYKDAVKWLAQFSDAETEEDSERFVRGIVRTMNRNLRTPMQRDAEIPWLPMDVIEPYEASLSLAEGILADKWGVTLPSAMAWRMGVSEAHTKMGYTGAALIIPHFFRHNLVGYQARWLSDDRPKKVPKYVNTDAFPRKETIFGWDRVDFDRPTVLVESVMTVIKLWQCSIQSVATFGGTATGAQLRLLRSLRSGVTVAYDADPDQKNNKGHLIKGTGPAFRDRMVLDLAPYVPLEIAHPPQIAKGDLADLNEYEILLNLSRSVPSFLLNTEGK